MRDETWHLTLPFIFLSFYFSISHDISALVKRGGIRRRGQTITLLYHSDSGSDSDTGREKDWRQYSIAFDNSNQHRHWHEIKIFSYHAILSNSMHKINVY